MAKELMNLRCNTCHEGHDPREEAPGFFGTSTPQATTDFTLRKQVNPETTCLKCHGQMNWQVMGLPGALAREQGHVRRFLPDLPCGHSHQRRHQVTYLNAEAIEAAAGQNNADVCYGCHGGRAWYRIAYPYPRHPWPGMPADVPDWAKDARRIRSPFPTAGEAARP
jgi:hypothetical protein